MLEVATEHVQLKITGNRNHTDQWYIHRCHMIKHAPLMLPSFHSVQPAMVLQNDIVKSNMWCLSCFSSLVHCDSPSLGFNVPLDLGRRVVGVVVVLLLLMSGDVETNPGPVGEFMFLSRCTMRSCGDVSFIMLIILKCVILQLQAENGFPDKIIMVFTTYQITLLFNLPENKLILDDLGHVLEEVLDISAEWYNLGLQLCVRVGKLNSIRTEFNTTKDQLREVLNAWLSTSKNPSWKTLIDALKSRIVGASRLAGDLETKYCPVKGTEVDRSASTSDWPGTSVFPPSPESQPIFPMVLQQTDMQESTRKEMDLTQTVTLICILYTVLQVLQVYNSHLKIYSYIISFIIRASFTFKEGARHNTFYHE